MDKEFIPYEIALELKELGFEEECLDFYDDNKELFYNHENKEKIHIGDSVKAPLYQQAFRWFREKYGYYIVPQPTLYIDKIEIHFLITSFGVKGFKTKKFNTYTEAELECLKKLIETVKQK